MDIPWISMDIHGYPGCPSNFHPIIHPLLIPLPFKIMSHLSCSRSVPFPRRPFLLDWQIAEVILRLMGR
jgi:hypothetical protein